MAPMKAFTTKIEEIQQAIEDLVDIDDREIVDATASRLTGLNYAPSTVLPVDNFLHFTKTDLLAEINRIAGLTDEELKDLNPRGATDSLQVKGEHIAVLFFYYKQLVELRSGNPVAWDEVDELYVHD